MYQLTYVTAYICTNLHMHWLTYTPAYICTGLHLYQLTYVPAYICTSLHMYQLTYVPAHICTSLNMYQLTFLGDKIEPECLRISRSLFQTTTNAAKAKPAAISCAGTPSEAFRVAVAKALSFGTILAAVQVGPQRSLCVCVFLTSFWTSVSFLYSLCHQTSPFPLASPTTISVAPHVLISFRKPLK